MIKFKLAEILEKKDLPQRFLVKACNIRSGTINAYYHGFIKRINVEDLNKICAALDCKIEDLLEYIPDKN